MARLGKALMHLLLFCAIVSLWEAIVHFYHVPSYVLPAPSGIAIALYRGVASNVYMVPLWVTLWETILGFLLGTVLAFVLGTSVALSRHVERFIYPYVVMFQAMPKVALAPLIVVWFGLGITSKIINAALIAFFPLMINTIFGLRSADDDRVNLMRSLDASEAQIFWMLRLPGALPHIMAGLEVAMIFSLIGAIVAEFVGAQTGLGTLIQSLNYSGDIAGVFSVLLILSVMGLLLNVAIAAIRRRVLFWDPAEKSLTNEMKQNF